MNYEEVVKATNRIIKGYTMRLTVRQLYYRIISPPFQLFGNNQNNYKQYDRILTRGREKHDVDWRKIEDRARSILGGEGTTFDSIDEYMRWAVQDASRTLNGGYYKVSRWADQHRYIECWVEKDALSSLFTEATGGYDVVVFPSRGYSSMTKVMEAIERFRDYANTTILHFTDHDPSGLDMTNDLRKRFEQYGFDLKIKRIALTIDQVRELDLPSNPTKSADARSPAYVAEYGDECWELDAVPPDTLSTWIKDAVEEEIDSVQWEETVNREEREKQKIASRFSRLKHLLGKFLGSGR